MGQAFPLHPMLDRGVHYVDVKRHTTMKWLQTILFAVAVCLAVGCGSSRTQTQHYSFEFAHDGVDYQIISVVAPDDRGHNFLTRRDDGRVILSAEDEDQNGTIDIVRIGDLALADVNTIYESGIDQARAGNKYRELRDARYFEYLISGESYVVNSLMADDGEGFYNTFVFHDADGTEVVGVDEDADGTLDTIRKGDADLTTSSQLYALALDQGVRDGKILRDGGRYLVTVPK